MAPNIEIPNKKDYQKMIKIADAVGIKYNLPDIKSSEDDFIYVPSIGLHVAKERTLLGKNFYESQEILHLSDQKMLNLSEFTEFLKYAKENHKEVYNEITEVRDPWRAEWIGADFKVQGKELFVNYHFFENGKIVQKSEKLDEDTLMEDKTPGISLEGWLKDSTKQGLPKNIVERGNLSYRAPEKDNNSVARFGANSDRANLDCYRDPSGRDSDLGVRAVYGKFE